MRVSCQTIALWTGSPVCRSHSDGRLALVGDADAPSTSRGVDAGLARAPSATTVLDVGPDLGGSCSTQPGLGKICWCSFWSTATMRPSRSKTMQRDELVPWSIAATYCRSLHRLIHRDGPRSREIARAASAHVGHHLAARRAVVAAAARTGPEMPIEPTVSAAAVVRSAPRATSSPGIELAPGRTAQPRAATSVELLAAARSRSVDGRVRGEALQATRRQLLERVLVARQQHPCPARCAMRGDDSAHRPRAPGGCRPGRKTWCDDQHLALVQRPDAHALVAARGERVGPVERARAQLVAVEVGRAHVQQRRAELVLARLGVLLDEADVLEGAQDDRGTSGLGGPSSPAS